MSGGPLDVSLRVRMRYEAGDTARRATADVEGIAAKARQLGAIPAGDKLSRDLRTVSGQAQATGRDLAQVAAAATRLGAGGVAGRLAGDLKGVAQAGGAVKTELTAIGQAAARFGSVSTVAYLGRDLKAAQAPAQALRRDLVDVGKAAEGIGRSRALLALDGDLQSASRKAEDFERRLVAIARRTGGQAGRGQNGAEFANEAIRASGIETMGLRFGMGGAAAGGLAAGAGVAAIGGGFASAAGRAVEFEHAMTEVGKAIGDTAGGMRGLERQFLDLSRRSGIAKTEIAGIAAQGGYFNVPRAQLPEFTDISTKAAVGFQMRADEAGEAFGPLIKSYKLPDMGSLRLAGDAINTVGDSVGVRERNILNYLNRTSGVAGMLRIPLPQNAAVGGAIQSLGVAPDVAATSFDQVARRLANANLHRDPEFSRGLRGIGMSGRQVKSAMDQDGLGGVMTVLEKLKALKPEKRSNVIQDLFGEGEVSNVSRMVESLDTLKGARGEAAEAIGWAKELEARPDGTYARMEWLGAGKAALAARTHRFISPTFHHDESGEATWLHSIALLAAPALSMPALASADLSRAAPATIPEALGLGPTADDASCLAAIGTLRADFVSVGLYADTLAALNAANGTLAELRAKIRRDRVAGLIDDALKSRKIVPAQRREYEALCGTDAGLAHVASLFAVTTPGLQPSGLDGRHPEAGEAETPITLAARATRYREQQRQSGSIISQADAIAHAVANPTAGR